MAITVETFGVHYRWPLPDELRQQLRLAHDLRKDLVTLQLDYETQLKAIWSSFPEVAAAETQIEEAETRVEAALEQIRADRITQRTKRTTGPAPDRLREAKARLKEARAARRTAITAAKPAADSAINDANTQRRAAQKSLYAHYCQEAGLYWATFNDVVAHHQTAVKRVQERRRAGQPSTLRHHRYDGTGTIAVQLQRQAGMPPRTPQMLADPSGTYRNVLLLPWTDPSLWDQMTRAEQRHSGRVEVRMRCGAGHITIPVQAHRMLPTNADVTGARLTLRRHGADLRATLTVTARITDPEPVEDGPLVAVHFGWRTNPDTDQITVAHWRSTSPLLIPASLRHLITAEPGSCAGTILTPPRLLARVTHADQTRSTRADNLNAIQAALVDWLASHEPPTDPTSRDDNTPLTAGHVAQWRNPGRFVRLARAWQEHPPDDTTEIVEALAEWARQDRIDWTIEARTRSKALRYRDDAYAQIAALITDYAGRIVLDDTNLTRVAAAPNTLPSAVTEEAAHRRTIAAVGQLRAMLAADARREGVPILEVDPDGISKTHHQCGHRNPADDRWLNQTVTCDGCGATYDQDTNAISHLITQALQRQPIPA